MHCGRDVLNVLGTKEKKGCLGGDEGGGRNEEVLFAGSDLDEDGIFKNLHVLSKSTEDHIGVSNDLSNHFCLILDPGGSFL